MYHFIVKTDACAAGETAVTEKCRLGAVALDIMADDPVDLQCAHAFANHLDRRLHCLGGDPACVSHFGYLFFIF